MTEETKLKISCTLKAKGIKPKNPMDWTGLKHTRPSPRIGETRPPEIGRKISEKRMGHLVSQETRDKISKNLFGRFRGNESPNWIDDRTKLKTDRYKMFDYQYRLWSNSVKKRDKWKCRITNGDCKGRLESHHILNWEEYPELRYDINNGITLCHSHHPRGREKEKRLSPYFQKLLA